MKLKRSLKIRVKCLIFKLFFTHYSKLYCLEYERDGIWLTELGGYLPSDTICIFYIWFIKAKFSHVQIIFKIIPLNLEGINKINSIVFVWINISWNICPYLSRIESFSAVKWPARGHTTRVTKEKQSGHLTPWASCQIRTSTDWKEREKTKVARRYFIKWKGFFC